MNKYLISLVLLSLVSCSQTQSDGKRLISSGNFSSHEYKIDKDFEAFEGGSFQSEKKLHDGIIKSSIVMLDEMRQKQRKKTPHASIKVHRDAHAKSHGCLNAKFVVNNQLLEPNKRLGLFSKNQSYSAYVRFSNNDHLANRDDNAPDLRGIGIKVLQVEGEKVMEDQRYANTQDFLMYGSKVFFIKDNAGYVKFIERLRQGEQLNSNSENPPRSEKIKKIWHRAKMLAKQPGPLGKTLKTQLGHRKVVNPLGMNYFSATPVRLGLEDDPNKTAMKYGIYPCQDVKLDNTSTKDRKHYMRENLEKTLRRSGKVCLDFKVQLQTHPEIMPIEDSTKLWPEKPRKYGKNKDKYSPYITVAKVEISLEDNKQLGSEESREFCENLSLTPWHSLLEHKPLGRTMRMRRDVYKAIAKFRRTANGVDQTEP